MDDNLLRCAVRLFGVCHVIRDKGRGRAGGRFRTGIVIRWMTRVVFLRGGHAVAGVIQWMTNFCGRAALGAAMKSYGPVAFLASRYSTKSAPSFGVAKCVSSACSLGGS